MREKHTDWVIEAVVMAKNKIPDLSLDIYGEGVEEAKIRKRIEELGCSEYVHLCGFQKLDEVYQNYDAYVSASYVETLGLTFLEALTSGLPIVAFDLPYGAEALIDEGKNGYKIEYKNIEELAKAIIRLFTEVNLEKFRQHSYKKAERYFREELEKRWKELLEQIR